MEFLQTVALLGCIQGFVLTIALAMRDENRLPNRLLSVVIGIISFFLLDMYIANKWPFPHPLTVVVPTMTISLAVCCVFAPMLYLYCAALTGKKKFFSNGDLLHFVPALLLVLLRLPVNLKSHAERVAYVSYIETHGFPLTESLILFGVFVLGLVYFVRIATMLRGFRLGLEAETSDLDTVRMHWIRVLLSIDILFWMLFGAYIVCESLRIPGGFVLLTLAIFCFSLLIMVAGFFSLREPDLFMHLHDDRLLDGVSTGESQAPSPVINETKYGPARIEQQTIDTILEKLESLMRDKKLYREPELGIREVAEELEIPQYQLSQAINSGHGCNFFNYINRLRVQEVMDILEKEPQANILTVAFQAGFNSKSSFNEMFKRFTGMTPRQFKNRSSINP